MLDNYYELYELKQKEYSQRIYTTKNRAQTVNNRSMRFHFSMAAIVVKAKELFTHNHSTTDVACCNAV